MEIVRTLLTPELATQLLAKLHPRQRRPARQTVALYAREMRTGRWRPDVPDPLLVDGEGQMFNGGHRCAAVIESGVTIDIEIRYGADPSLFDVIDVGRRRSAYQFITEANAGNRAAAARGMLWYRRRFDHPLAGATGVGYFDMAEIIGESDRAADALADAMPLARIVYEFTNIPTSLGAAVFVLAAEEGVTWEQITDFRDSIVGMANLPAKRSAPGPGRADASEAPSRPAAEAERGLDRPRPDAQRLPEWRADRSARSDPDHAADRRDRGGVQEAAQGVRGCQMARP